MAEWVFATQESENITQRMRVLLLTGTEYLIKGHAINYPAAYSFVFFLFLIIEEKLYISKITHKERNTNLNNWSSHHTVLVFQAFL